MDHVLPTMSRRAWLLPALLVCAAACQHRSPPPPIALSLPPLSFPPPNVAPAMPSISLATLEPPPIDLSWLDSDEFLPPGATRIGGEGLPAATLRLPERMRYPSVDQCPAPDNRGFLYCQSMGTDRFAVHWLQLRRRDSIVESSLFRTPKAFEVTWSPDSRHVAITHAVGENRSEIVLTNPDREMNPPPLDLRTVLSDYFSESQVLAPCFLKAYRWTDASALVVRGIGMTALPPYDQFGFEVLVDLQRLNDPASPRFLRGFVKKTAARSAEVAPR
ncbi:MAG TPA: hypothetical protein VM029_06065 [Opitutaceae bacterium]|nr:hypothetical protein [Opitutaceae bacterium]